MAFVPPHDRVLDTSTSNSQSIFAISGAGFDTSYNTFSASMSVGDTTIGGVVEVGVAFKSGVLTYSNTNEVTVTTVKESKGTFSASGSKQVFMGQPALAALLVDGGQSLTATQQAQARANVYAAPFDALAYSGMQINGSMDVSQENGTTQLTLANNVAKYVIDQWQGYYTATGPVFKAQQVTPPGSPSFGSAFQNCLQLTATAAMPAPGIGDQVELRHLVEGYRWSRLGFGAAGAQPVTIGFWVYATVTGTATLCVRNSATARTYLANFTVNNAATWEYKTITVPGDTSGTWLTTTGIGATIAFNFYAGSNLQAGNNAWSGGSYGATSSSTNFFASINNTVCVTGVIVLPGSDSPVAARSPFVMRPFADELALSKRYWEATYNYGVSPGTASAGGGEDCNATTNTVVAGLFMGHIAFYETKRTTPTMTAYGFSGTSGALSDQSGTDHAGTAQFAGIGTRGFIVRSAGSTFTTTSFEVVFHWVADARM